uniref:Glycoside hydrolase family 5 domain-containing protein n=1 Tax=Cuerna arida TaxID=1464854 RepID=A0A1B6EUB5_9HEMI
MSPNVSLFVLFLCALSVGKQMRGVNRSGAEFKCVQNQLGVFDGPVDDVSIKAMKTWNINIVRVPLNEDCWLAINDHNPAFSGKNYINAVVNFVNLLRQNNLTVILDLHWTDGLYAGKGQGSCYDKTAKCQKPMADRQNATKFWASVARRFMDDEEVIFDLFNEPYPDQVISNNTQAWRCWRDGGDACPGFQYEVAGMQDLVNAVRSVGSTNRVMLGGLRWSNDLSRWMEYLPSDSANNIVASWHCYNWNECIHKKCWDSEIAPVAAKYPLIVGEIGEDGCKHSFIDGLMPWLDKHDISYLAWTWNAWDCYGGPVLIKDYTGTPTNFGKGFKDHLAGN